jgi:hypothetical protein
MTRQRYMGKDENGEAVWVNVNDLRQISDMHYIQTDEIPPTTSYADNRGLVFTSKSKLMEHYKEVGVVCTGGEHWTGKGVDDWKYESDEAEMLAASKEEMNKARWGMMPCTDREKQLWTEEQRMMEGKSNNREYLVRQSQRK